MFDELTAWLAMFYYSYAWNSFLVKVVQKSYAYDETLTTV